MELSIEEFIEQHLNRLYFIPSNPKKYLLQKLLVLTEHKSQRVVSSSSRLRKKREITIRDIDGFIKKVNDGCARDKNKKKSDSTRRHHINNGTILCYQLNGNCDICPYSKYETLSDGQCQCKEAVKEALNRGYIFPNKKIHYPDVDRYLQLTKGIKI